MSFELHFDRVVWLIIIARKRVEIAWLTKPTENQPI